MTTKVCITPWTLAEVLGLGQGMDIFVLKYNALQQMLLIIISSLVVK